MTEPTDDKLTNWRIDGTIEGSGEIDIVDTSTPDGEWLVATCYGPRARQNATAIIEAHITVETLRRALEKELHWISNLAADLAEDSIKPVIAEGQCNATVRRIAAALAHPAVDAVRLEWERLTSDLTVARDKANEYLHDAQHLAAQLAAETARADRAESERAKLCEPGRIEARFSAIEKLAGPEYSPLSSRPVELFVQDRIEAAEAEVARLKARITKIKTLLLEELEPGCECDYCTSVLEALKGNGDE